MITLKATCQFKELIIVKQRILKFNWQKQTSKQNLAVSLLTIAGGKTAANVLTDYLPELINSHNKKSEQ